MEPYLYTARLAVGYGGKPLIENICLHVRRGEIMTLIGPNGGGKSTILKTLARQLTPMAGAVYLDKQALGQMAEKELAQRLAIVTTERIDPELMTCRDIVATGRYPYTGRLGLLTKRDEEKVSEAMETVHALELSHRDFNAVSDGQRQRILLARAICQEPEIIILDEPTSYLDIRHKLELLSILRSMAKEKGITVIMSLHEIDLAQKISDKIICVKGDTIGSYGTPEEVFDEEKIRQLYNITEGFFDPCFGSIELPRPRGNPEILVLSACGSGIPVYRRLQMGNIPFCAGILYTNDLDYRLARLLASEVITERPFHEISDAAFDRAMEKVHTCRCVLDAGCEIGPCNRRMQEILDAAKNMGKLETA